MFFFSFLHSKINQPLHRILLAILTSLSVFFSEKMMTFLGDFPCVFAQKKCESMNNKDLALVKKKKKISVNNLDSLSRQLICFNPLMPGGNTKITHT